MTEAPAAADVPVRKGAALAFAAALAVTVLMAWPVLRAPGERIFGSGAILGRDLRRGPRTLETLGLSALSPHALRERLHEGGA